MDNSLFKRYDKTGAIVFGALSLVFIALAILNESFFVWAFERHQNQLSWYIRPLFLIPFCIFAYKRSWSGLAVTLFLLITSMIWFPKPESVSENIRAFLSMEQEYLTGTWSIAKIAITLLVPISLSTLALACWKRSLLLGISVLIFIAVAKILWSVVFGGASGTSVIAPAIIGLIICIITISVGFMRLKKKNKYIK